MSQFFTCNATHLQLIIKGLCLSALLLSSANPASQGAPSTFSLRPREVTPRLDQPRQDELANSLKLNEPVERDLAGGNAHDYQITLSEGQYMRIVVEQRNIDVVLTLFGPDAKQLVRVDDDSTGKANERISQVAVAPGAYRLNIAPKQKASSAGRYRILLLELRAATENDRALQQARDLHTQSLGLYRAGKYDEAKPLSERALAIREKAVGPDNLDLADILDQLAIVLSVKADYAKAEPLFQRALKIRETELGANHPDVALSLNNLALFYQFQGEYEKAASLFQRSIDAFEKALGPEHTTLAHPLNNFGVLYLYLGDYVNAERFFRRSLIIREKSLGLDHVDVAQSVGNLAIVYLEQAKYAEAEQLYDRALLIREKVQGREHPELFNTLNNLAGLYRLKGDFKKAEPLLLRALGIYRKAFGENHPNVARALDRLAVFYTVKDDYSNAEPLFRQALAIREITLGPNHFETADSLLSLAVFYSVNGGEYEKAEPLYQRALAIQEKTVGPEHPNIAVTLDNLAIARRVHGKYAEAESLHQRALQIREKIFGMDHPDVAQTLANLATVYLAKGDVPHAIASESRAIAISERHIGINLAVGSERQKLAYLATLAHELDRAISLHVRYAPHDSSARDLALTMILQRKGRVLDTLFDSMAAISPRLKPRDRSLLDELRKVRAQLARLILGPQGATPAQRQKEINSLEEKEESLEAEISGLVAEFRAQSHPVTIESVQSLIPTDAALVEFTSYRPFNAKSQKPDQVFGEPRYIAYILKRGTEPQWVDLGAANPINQAVNEWRKALSHPNRTDVQQLAQILEKLIIRPIRNHFGKAKLILLSPDGDLNLIPFGALVDERRRYLFSEYSLSYLSSGRDLLRLRTQIQSKSNPLIIADPAYGERSQEERSAPQAPAQEKSVIGKLYFGPLLTGSEALAIKRIIPESRVLLKKDATEAALKSVKAPLFLHIATHGFFLGDVDAVVPGSRSLSMLGSLAAVPDLSSGDWISNIENPLLRSGLALSGANRGSSGDEDGVLTALEATSLDLWGTKLVVLSACDSGVGQVRKGEGVYGLRRSFVLAGSETQVMSLWKVRDDATRDLMIAYYANLKRGMGRGEALRQVQLAMLRNPTRKHPYYWGSFIQSGEWANLAGQR
jgi:CHAT domain-containing protein/Tfp pilus assembly protein PilF